MFWVTGFGFVCWVVYVLNLVGGNGWLFALLYLFDFCVGVVGCFSLRLFWVYLVANDVLIVFWGVVFVISFGLGCVICCLFVLLCLFWVFSYLHIALGLCWLVWFVWCNCRLLLCYWLLFYI